MHRREWLKTIPALGGAVLLAGARGAAQSAGSVAHARPMAPEFGPAVSGLRLGVQWVNNFTMAFVLENVSTAPITVFSHVTAGTTHLDWYSLQVESAMHSAPLRTLRFVGARNRSAAVTATLAPAGRISHEVDTRVWGREAVNRPPPGWTASRNYLLSASYDTTGEHQHWRGRLASGVAYSGLDLGG